MNDKSKSLSDPGKRMRKVITYPATIKKIGNSFHILIPKDYVVEECGWKDGSKVTVMIMDESVMLTPTVATGKENEKD